MRGKSDITVAKIWKEIHTKVNWKVINQRSIEQISIFLFHMCCCCSWHFNPMWNWPLKVLIWLLYSKAPCAQFQTFNPRHFTLLSKQIREAKLSFAQRPINTWSQQGNIRSNTSNKHDFRWIYERSRRLKPISPNCWPNGMV